MKPVIAPLFVPATRPDRFAKAAASGADAVIVDLEDAVPAFQKIEARANLGEATALQVPVLIRINAETTPWHEADLDELKRLGLRSICVPKVGQVDLLDRIALKLGGEIQIMAQIETAAGVENAAAIAAHRSVRQLAFGPADFFLDMDMPPSREMTGHVLPRLAVASRAAGIAPPLDGPCFAISDSIALAAECAFAVACGAGGKLCIHPSQPAAVLECFLPRPEELDWALRIVATDGDGGVRTVDGQMIDAPLVARARTLLDRAGVTTYRLASSSPDHEQESEP